MFAFRKKLSKKISAHLFFAALIIFVLLVSVILINMFYVKSNSQEINSSITRATRHINKQVTNRQSDNKISSSSSKQTTTQTAAPVISGNQIIIPVLYYHYVGNNPNATDLQRNALSISPDKFDEQMKYLRDNGFHAVSYDTLYAALKKQTTLPSKPIILTFDDGYIDFYYNAYNILRQYGLSATEFIPTGLVGLPSYLTWSQISEMHNSGLISFGAHSVHHYHLASLSPEAALFEITQSKKDLQDHLGININFMAYPYGETSSNVVSLVQKAGYVGAIGTWSSKIQSEGTIYNLPRLRVSGSMSISSFASLVQ